MLDKFYKLIRMMVPDEFIGLSEPPTLGEGESAALPLFIGLLFFSVLGTPSFLVLATSAGFESTPLKILGYYVLFGFCYFIITTVLYCKASTKDKDVMNAIANDKNNMSNVTKTLLIHAVFWTGSLLMGIIITTLFVIYAIAKFVVDIATKKIITKLLKEDAVENRLKGE